MDKHIETLAKTKEEVIKEALAHATQEASTSETTSDKEKLYSPHPSRSHKHFTHDNKKLKEDLKSLIHSFKTLEKSIKKTYTRIFDILDKKHHEAFTSLKDEVLKSLEEHHHKLKSHTEQLDHPVEPPEGHDEKSPQS